MRGDIRELLLELPAARLRLKNSSTADFSTAQTTYILPSLSPSQPVIADEIIIRAKRVSNCYMREKKN